MSLRLKSANSLSALQALVVAEFALGYYYVPHSLDLYIDEVRGPTYSCLVDSTRARLSTTFTQYASEALMSAAIVHTTICSDQESYVFQTPDLGDVFVLKTNDATAAIGAVVSSIVASGSAAALTTAVTANMTSIATSRGRWLLTGAVSFQCVDATVTQFDIGGSGFSATLPTTTGERTTSSGLTLAGYSGVQTLPLTPRSFDSADFSTLHAAAQAVFSVGTVAVFGQLHATRIQ